jgi:tetratricopeptide (TPR) repeat protein
MSSIPRRVLTAVVFSSLLVTTALVAADHPWGKAPFSADPKALLAAAQAVQPKSKDEGVVVLLDEAQFVFDAAGRSSRTERLIYRVDEEASVEDWSTVEAPYSPWYLEKPKIEARVVTKDGSVHLLDPKSFGTADAENEPDMFDDTRVVRGPLPAVAAGSVVEQLITYKEKNPLYEAGTAQRYQFGRGVETELTRLIIEYPATLPMNVVNRTKPRLEPQRSESGGVVRLLFENGVMQVDEDLEWSLPSDLSNYSYVAFSTGKSWQDVARRYSEIVDKQIAAAPVDKLAPPIAGNEKDPQRIAARILDAVERRIRYAGVEFGEGSIVPRSPAQTLANKYGDCKDKATLLVAMLRQAGVPSHVALLDAGSGLDVEHDLPGLGHFNHAIAVIDGREPIWIDPTDEFARAGELPSQDQGRLALIASPETTALTLTPSMPSTANRMSQTREFKLAEDGKAALTETTEYFGSDERSSRRRYAGSDLKSQREGLNNYASSTYLAKEVAKFEVADAHDLTRPFRIRFDVAESTRGITARGEAAVAIFMSRLFEDFPWELKSDKGEQKSEPKPNEKPRKPRAHDFIFSEPYVVDLNYRVMPPPGYVLRTTPENESLTLGTATLTKSFTVQPDGLVLATYHFDSGPSRITAAQFEQTRVAVSKAARDKEAFLLYFDQVGRKYLDAGDVGKAIAEFRRLAVLHPKEALHHSDAAKALLAGGMGSAARREAKLAVEIEPKSARAHQTLGLILASDLIGREFGKGFDHKGAIAEYRKAKELDPKDVYIRAELAVLLARNDTGTHYGPGAPLGEAIDEYLAIKKDVESNEDAVDRELMLLYTRSARFAELKKLVDATKDTQKKDTFRLVAVAGLQGSATAVTESSSIALAGRREAQTAAAGFLAMMRLYPEAAELLAAAAQGAPNAAELRVRADMFRKTKKYELATEEKDEPQALFKKILIAALQDEEFEAIKPLMTADVVDVMDDSEKKSRSKGNKAAAEGVRLKAKMKKEAMIPFYIDVALAAIQLQQDGSEDVGYRLRARATTTAMPEMSIFVVRDAGHYRVAGVSTGGAGMMGLRALRLADAGKLEAARQWLDWAREFVKGSEGDDPVSSEPFASLWTRGQAGSLDDVRLAAASLLPDTKKSCELALPVLLAARPAATAERQGLIDRALASAYRITENWTELLATAERLVARYPASAVAFEMVNEALLELGRRDEVEKRALKRLETLRNDSEALRTLGALATERNDYAGAFDYYGKVLDAGQPSDNDYNSHAWAALFAQRDLEKAVEEARQAVSSVPGYAALNTLAVLYAEQGKTSEARDTLLKSIDARGEEDLNGPDWYVLGRLAENYGVNEAAVEAYQKVSKPEKPAASSYQLAQKRLAVLKGK